MIPYPYNNLDVIEENSKHWITLCPFHREEEGSFTINKGGRFPLWFKCWGCNCQGSPRQYAKHFKMNPSQIKYVKQEKETPVVVDWEDRMCWEGSEVVVREFAQYLGLSRETINKFRVGYYKGKFLVPMFRGDTGISGIQEHYWELKTEKHIKKLQVHSKHGLFVPLIDFNVDKPLFILEGFSDTATAIELGLQAIGRFNAGYKLSDVTIKSLSKFSEVVFVTDSNAVGIEGAIENCEKLPNASIIYLFDILQEKNPKYEDLREMYLAIGREKTEIYLDLNS